jgi:uncharacterized protein
MLELSIRIKDIDEGGQHLEVPLARPMLKDGLEGMQADIARSHVTAHLDLSRVGETVSVRGRLGGDVQVACVRCLGEAHVDVDVPLRITVGADELGGEDSLQDDVEYFTHDGETIELAGILREALILAVPMTTLCSDGCKGLCAVCGADRNVTDCGHTQSPPDPRFAALRDLKLSDSK